MHTTSAGIADAFTDRSESRSVHITSASVAGGVAEDAGGAVVVNSRLVVFLIVLGVPDSLLHSEVDLVLAAVPSSRGGELGSFAIRITRRYETYEDWSVTVSWGQSRCHVQGGSNGNQDQRSSCKVRDLRGLQGHVVPGPVAVPRAVRHHRRPVPAILGSGSRPTWAAGSR